MTIYVYTPYIPPSQTDQYPLVFYYTHFIDGESDSKVNIEHNNYQQVPARSQLFRIQISQEYQV